MDFTSLHKLIDDCDCGHIHKCDIDDIIIENGANKKIPELLKSYGCREVIVVSDNNTHPLCAHDIALSIEENHIKVTELIYNREGMLIPDERAIAQLLGAVSHSVDLICGVGAGVINDICKYISYKTKIPYIISATAPSMDGYASSGCAMIIENMKITYDAHVPKAIIGDIDILKNAPIDLIKAGVGDMIGKISCLNDWRIANIVTGEVLCDYLYSLTENTVKRCIEDVKEIISREDKSIQKLMEGLVIVGIAMSYAGNSRPASGSEHHLSHFYEVINIMSGGEYFLHGIDVAYSTAITNSLRHKLAGESPDIFLYEFDESVWKSDIRRIFFDAADGVIALQSRTGLYGGKNTQLIIENWEQIKDVLLDVPTYDETLQLLQDAGIEMKEFNLMYGIQTIQNSIEFAKDLKDRYTLFWLLWDIGLLSIYAKEFSI